MNIKKEARINTQGQSDIILLNEDLHLLCVGQDQTIKLCALNDFQIDKVEFVQEFFLNCFQLSDKKILLTSLTKIFFITTDNLENIQVFKELEKEIINAIQCNDTIYLFHENSVSIYNHKSKQIYTLDTDKSQNVKCISDNVYFQQDNQILQIVEQMEEEKSYFIKKIFKNENGFQDFLVLDQIIFIYKDKKLFKQENENLQEISNVEVLGQFNGLYMLNKDRMVLSYDSEIIIFDHQQKEILIQSDKISHLIKIVQFKTDYILLTQTGSIYHVNTDELFTNTVKRKALQDQSDIEEDEEDQKKQKDEDENQREQKEEIVKDQDKQLEEDNNQSIKDDQSQVDYHQNEYQNRKSDEYVQHQEDLQKFCEVYPQNQIIPGACAEQKGRELIKQNIYGKIRKFTKNQKSEIEVEFNDHNLSEKLIFSNDKNYCLGDINKSAFILATQGYNTEVDEYQNEEDDMEMLCSIYFKEVGRKNEWEINFEQEFQIVQVTISNMLIYVISQQDELRVFSYGGIEVFNRTLNGPIICMSAFQHLFAYVYQNSLPMYGRQNLKTEIFDFYTFKIKSDFKLSLTPFNQLVWFGYSDDGILYCQDESGYIRMSVNNQYWITIHRPIDDRVFWLYGIMDKELIGHRLGHEEKVLQLNKDYNVFRIIPKCDVVTKDVHSSKEHRQILYEISDKLNEQQKYEDFKHLKHTITDDFHLKSLQEKILDYEQQQEINTQLEYKKLDLARQCIDKGDESAALYQVLQIRQEDFFLAGIELFEELKYKKLVQQLKEIAQERGLMMNFQSQQKAPQYENIQRTSSEREQKLQKYLEEDRNTVNVQQDFFNMELSESNNSKRIDALKKSQKKQQKTNNNHQIASKKVNNNLLGALNNMKNKKME